MKRFAALFAVLAIGATPLTTQASLVADSADPRNSDNLSFVANVPAALADGRPAGGGSDVEFATIDVTELEWAKEAGITGERTYALMGTIDLGGPNGGLQIIDITDPEAPVKVAVYDCRVSQGDVQVFERDGRTIVSYAADYSASQSRCHEELADLGIPVGNRLGAYFADITDPHNPVTVGYINIPQGSHNTTIHPSGQYLYNSNNELTAGIGGLEYFDISDLTAPVKLGEIDLETGIDSHDLTFNADGSRAYSAAVNHTLIIDTTDPANPSIISRIIDPAATIHHQSDPVTLTHPVLGERDFLVVTDELGGAAGNAVCPGGGLMVYDVTGDLELTPVKVGAWFIPQTEVNQGQGNGSFGVIPACTSHVLRFYPEQALMTIGWYSAGVRVVDISNLVGVSLGVTPDVGDTGAVAGMHEIGYYVLDDSNSWAAKTPHIEEDGSFYLYSSDIQRGFDVFHFDGSAASSADPGTWLTPQQHLSLKQSNLTAGRQELAPWCTLVGLRDDA